MLPIQNSLSRWAMCLLLVGCVASLVPSTASALAPPQDPLQDPLQDPFGTGNPFPGPPGVAPGQEVTLTAEYKLKPGTNEGEVTLTASIAFGYHIYSLTQVDGPGPSTITLTTNPNVKLAGSFEADTDPHVVENDPQFGVRVEQYEAVAIFSAPIEVTDVENPEDFTFELIYDGQVCDSNGCRLIEGEKVKVRFGGYLEVPLKPGEYRSENSHLRFEGYLEPKVAEPGDTIRLVITAFPDAGFHTYGFKPGWDQEAQDAASCPTLIALTKRNGWTAELPQASVDAKAHAVGESNAYWHEEPVTWSIDIKVPRGTEKKEYEISGFLGFQTCKGEEFCDLPDTAEFSAKIKIGTDGETGQIPLEMISSSRSYEDVDTLAQEIQWGGHDASGFGDKPLAVILGFAFLAGLILNVMPCVLPVIGLKIMSFVDQAGESRWNVISLNLWFSAGLIFVFLVLATLAAVFGMGWGQHFQSVGFTVTLIAIVFTFALSFLGVWEIPIPGFVGSHGAAKMANREGAIGAFSKGVFTTILATPCTGPFLVPAISWAITQPAWLTYLLFFMVGLGMSSPYLLIGLFPGMIKLLPKPGPWMETFKQLMGFVLLGTAVFLFNALGEKLVLPTLTLLVGIAVACWWIGKTPITASRAKRTTAWVGGGVWTLLIACFSYLYLAGGVELEWQPFDRTSLADQVEEGNTVLVDFTADW